MISGCRKFGSLGAFGDNPLLVPIEGSDPGSQIALAQQGEVIAKRESDLADEWAASQVSSWGRRFYRFIISGDKWLVEVLPLDYEDFVSISNSWAGAPDLYVPRVPESARSKRTNLLLVVPSSVASYPAKKLLDGFDVTITMADSGSGWATVGQPTKGQLANALYAAATTGKAIGQTYGMVANPVNWPGMLLGDVWDDITKWATVAGIIAGGALALYVLNTLLPD